MLARNPEMLYPNSKTLQETDVRGVPRHTSAHQMEAHTATLSTFQVPLGHAQRGLPDP